MAVKKTTTFSESNININNNTSSLSIKIYFSANNSITWFNSATLSCTCNGVTKTKTVSHPTGGSVSTTFTFDNIAHNNDGTKNVSWSWRCPTGTSTLETMTDSGTKKLTTINRKAIVTSASDFTDTTNPTLNFSNPGGFKVYPYINLWTQSSNGTQIGTTIRPEGMDSHGAKLTSPYTWNLSDEQRNEIRNWFGTRTSGWATVGVTTFNGNTNLGSSSKGVTFTNNLIKPIFSNFEYQDINIKTRAITNSDQDIILDYSTLQITIADSNKAVPDINGAAISYYLINDIQYNYADSVIVTLENWNSSVIEVTAVDTRGISTKVTKSLNVVNYVPLQKGNIKLLRDGNISEETTLTYDGTMQKRLPNGDNNTLTVSYEYKKTSDETYTTGTTSIIPTVDNDGNFNFNNYITGDIVTGFSIDDSFNVTVIVSDVLSSVQYTYTLNSGIPAIAVKGNKIALHGSYDENNDADIQLNGKTSLNGGNLYGEYVLYDNSSGDNGTITLEDSAENYTYLEIFYKNNNGLFKSIKVYEPNEKTVNLDMVVGSTSTIWLQTGGRYINGTSISTVSGRGLQCNIKQNTTIQTVENFYIVRVVGYK